MHRILEPFVQSINAGLHKYPLSLIIHGIYWFFILTFASTFVGICYIFFVAFQLITGATKSSIDARACGKELAVYVTGCDSGFGKDIAYKLSERGFVVFAACLTKEGVEQYADAPSVVALKVDVTKKEQVDDARTKISSWLSSAEADKPPRFLHAVINNAGIGSIGCIDWLTIEDFRKDMEVNYFGTIRITKSMLPILKSQAISRSHTNARVINVTSMAGLVTMPNGSAYHSSKFAAEAFSNVLRMELKAFDLFVTTVNPSFHKSPMADSMSGTFEKRWESIGEEMRGVYGEAFFEKSKDATLLLPNLTMWDPSIVTTEVVNCVEANKPDPQIIIGSDAKFILLLVRMIPVWLQDMTTSHMVGKAAAMK